MKSGSIDPVHLFRRCIQHRSFAIRIERHSVRDSITMRLHGDEQHPHRSHTMSRLSNNYESVLTANNSYAANFGDKGKLALPPARRFAILTCMDARLDPAKYAGLAEGDAHVIRNAGGRASDDAIRSLVISHKLLGTREWFVIHHTNCGMELFTNEIMGDLLTSSLETAEFDGKEWATPKQDGGSVAGRVGPWQP